MAVTFKGSESYGFSLLSLFGVSPVLIANVKEAGIGVTQAVPGVFKVVGPDGKEFGTVAVKGSAISMAKAGTIGPSSKKSVAINFENLLVVALANTHPTDFITPPTPDPTPFGKGGPSAHEDINDIFKEKEAYKNGSTAPNFLGVQQSFGFKLGQSVAGSTPGTSYSVLAFFPDLVMMARNHGGVLSVRMLTTGPAGSTLVSTLSELGFTSKKGAYWSAHYTVGSGSLVKKTLGAIIGHLGNDKIIGLLKGSV